MHNLSWEKDLTQTPAGHQSRMQAYISPPGARQLVSALMHEATTISATFSDEALLVFKLTLGISVFEKKTGTFYGLYASDTDSDALPNFCIRKATWRMAFGNVDKVLESLESTSSFFRNSQLPLAHSAFVTEACNGIIRNIEVTPRTPPSEDPRILRYYALEGDYSLRGEYRAFDMHSAYVEQLFMHLEALHQSTETQGSILPVPGTFRISYTFDGFDFLR
ncbi:hypothetical protein AB7M33_003054 [Pseudomonas sp. Y3 TE3536]|jgi:hypothetical protein